ncbi:TPA: FAD-dependent oxidoreductase [Serratia marcescens]|uniref:FAD-dependent oxidoreductase n=1 Tax=Serratia marcescens TaxID=615 RepID=UPI0024A7412D|nr:FAD-dependent oxidoreductase [Serratia marcescens]
MISNVMAIMIGNNGTIAWVAFPDSSRLTVFSNGHDIPPDIRTELAARQVPLVDGRIAEIARHGSQIATIKIDTGTDVAVDILFAHPLTRPSTRLHDALGLATLNTPTGIVLKTDERHETSMPGIYAAGDLANAGIPSVTTATWQGAMAGIFAQQSMLT